MTTATLLNILFNCTQKAAPFGTSLTDKWLFYRFLASTFNEFVEVAFRQFCLAGSHCSLRETCRPATFTFSFVSPHQPFSWNYSLGSCMMNSNTETSRPRILYFIDHFWHGSVSDLVPHAAPTTSRMKQLKYPMVNDSVGTNGKDYVKWHRSSDYCLLIYGLSQNT